MAQATFVETSQKQQSIAHEGYIYQKIRVNGEQSWWRRKHMLVVKGLLADALLVLHKTYIALYNNFYCRYRCVFLVHIDSITFYSVYSSHFSLCQVAAPNSL